MNGSELQNAFQTTQDYFYSHIYGPGSSNKETLLPDLVRNNNPGKLVIVAFKSNGMLMSTVRHLERLKRKFDTQLIDTTTLLYCTTFKARRIVQNLIKTNDTDRLVGSFIFLADVDKFDANAYGIWLLYKERFENKLSLILLSISPHSWLPKTPNPPVEVGQELIGIVYLPNPTKMLTDLRTDFLVLGTTNVKNKKIEHVEPNTYYAAGKILFDLNFNKNTTQHEVYLREDVMRLGVIYRAISEAGFNKLKDRTPASKKGDIRKVLADMISQGFVVTVDKIYQKDLQEVRSLDTGGIAKNILHIVGGLPLDFDPSCFLATWIVRMSIMKKNGASEAGLTAAGYYGSLLAVLIDIRPDYGDLTDYVGQDDIETLINFWNAIMAVTYDRAYNLPEKSGYYLEKWCQDNKLNTNRVFELCSKVNKTLRYVMDIGMLRKHSKILTTDQRVSSINRIRKALSVVYPRKPAKSYTLHNLLPRTPWSKITPETLITPLNRFGSEVYSFLNIIQLPEEVYPVSAPSSTTSSVVDLLADLDDLDAKYDTLA